PARQENKRTGSPALRRRTTRHMEPWSVRPTRSSRLTAPRSHGVNDEPPIHLTLVGTNLRVGGPSQQGTLRNTHPLRHKHQRHESLLVSRAHTFRTVVVLRHSYLHSSHLGGGTTTTEH